MNQLDLFNRVIKTGSITLSKAFGYNYPIVTIKAVVFTEQYGDEEDDEFSTKWNAYVGRIRSAIGVETYCEWVRNVEGDMVGILSFYNKVGEEIKVKHFRDWHKLCDKIDGKVIEKPSYLYGEIKIHSKSAITVKKGYEYMTVILGRAHYTEYLNREMDTDIWYDSLGNEAHIKSKKNKARKQYSKYD